METSAIGWDNDCKQLKLFHNPIVSGSIAGGDSIQNATLLYFSLSGDPVSMLTHIYPHKPRRKIEVTICKITRLTVHFMCNPMSALLICKFIKSMVIHDTKCPY